MKILIYIIKLLLTATNQARNRMCNYTLMYLRVQSVDATYVSGLHTTEALQSILAPCLGVPTCTSLYIQVLNHAYKCTWSVILESLKNESKANHKRPAEVIKLHKNVVVYTDQATE